MTAEPPQSLPAAPSSDDYNGELPASAFQVAILNNLLPRGFRFELYENARKADPTNAKCAKRKKPVPFWEVPDPSCSNPIGTN